MVLFSQTTEQTTCFCLDILFDSGSIKDFHNKKSMKKSWLIPSLSICLHLIMQSFIWIIWLYCTSCDIYASILAILKIHESSPSIHRPLLVQGDRRARSSLESQIKVYRGKSKMETIVWTPFIFDAWIALVDCNSQGVKG